MKNTIRLFSFLMVTCLAISSCKKNDTLPPNSITNNTSTSPTFTAIVNGNSFNPTSINYGHTQGGFCPGSNILTATFSSPAITKVITLLWFTSGALPSALGTYSLNYNYYATGNCVNATYQDGPNPTSLTSYGTSSGTLVITKSDATNHKISGTFNFTDGSSMNVTNGAFTDVTW